MFLLFWLNLVTRLFINLYWSIGLLRTFDWRILILVSFLFRPKRDKVVQRKLTRCDMPKRTAQEAITVSNVLWIFFYCFHRWKTTTHSSQEPLSFSFLNDEDVVSMRAVQKYNNRLLFQVLFELCDKMFAKWSARIYIHGMLIVAGNIASDPISNPGWRFLCFTSC